MFAIDHHVLPGANEVSGDVMESGQNQICSLHSTIYCCPNQFSFVVGFVFSLLQQCWVFSIFMFADLLMFCSQIWNLYNLVIGSSLN
jgi:hypothetical protein